MPGCCAVGSAPALGAGGREFESRHSDHEKSHDEALEIAFISWLYLLHIGLKMAGKCDRIATNSEKTCFVRQCAPLFCMPCLYHTAVLWAAICPCFGGIANHYTHITPLMGERYLIPTLYTRVSARLTTPTQKRVSIDTSGNGVNLTDCTDLCNRLKIERVSMPSKLSVFFSTIFGRIKGVRENDPLAPVQLIALSQNCDARRGLSAFGCAYL